MPPTQCAIDDLRDGRLRVVEPIAELYFALGADQERLGPDLQAVRATLTHKIRMMRDGDWVWASTSARPQSPGQAIRSRGALTPSAQT